MKIITRKSQDRATAHLMQIMSAIFSHDDIELLNSLGAVAELAYIIGGIGMMETLKPNSSEKPNNSTRSKMEQVDKDTNVLSKDCETCRFDDKYGEESICSNCSRHYSDCYEPKDEHSGEVTEMVEPQTEGLKAVRDLQEHFGIKREPTLSEMVEDEPQTDIEIARAIVHKAIDDAVIAEDAYPDLRQKMHDAVDNYEPQTERHLPDYSYEADFGKRIMEQTDCPQKGESQ